MDLETKSELDSHLAYTKASFRSLVDSFERGGREMATRLDRLDATMGDIRERLVKLETISERRDEEDETHVGREGARWRAMTERVKLLEAWRDQAIERARITRRHLRWLWVGVSGMIALAIKFRAELGQAARWWGGH